MDGVQTASRLQSHYEETVYFIPTKFPEIPSTHLMNHRRMKDWVDLGAT